MSFPYSNKARPGRPRKNPRYVLYARFSPRPSGRGRSGDADNTQSIETQMDLMEAWCRQRKVAVYKRFADRAKSGADWERPGLWSALKELGRGDVLLVYAMDRLARDVKLFTLIEIELDKVGATYMCVEGGMAYAATAEEAVLAQMLKIFTEWMRKVNGQRTAAAMLRYMAEGRRMGGFVPYGWDVDPNNDRRLVPVPAEQGVMMWIAERRREGCSIHWMAKMLQKCNAPHGRGRVTSAGTVIGRWTPDRVKRILKTLARRGIDCKPNPEAKAQPCYIGWKQGFGRDTRPLPAPSAEQLPPESAESWSNLADGRTISFNSFARSSKTTNDETFL